MNAALLKDRAASREDGYLSRTRLARDLSQIADLVALCFADRLDGGGRSAVREMKVMGSFGPLLWLLGWLDNALGIGLGLGYVWRAGARVVGNVSLYRGGRHPRLGRGWLIANVAVHPDYRRRGIARSLMEAGIADIRERGGRWVSLQVEADNTVALRLYDSMGFERHETLTHWEAARAAAPYPHGDLRIWDIRARQPAEAPVEAAFIFNRARVGAMAWTRTIEVTDIEDGGLGGLLQAGGQEHWLLTPAFDPEHVVGVLWLQRGTFERPRLTLFLDPALHDREARQALVRHALNLPGVAGRPVRIEVEDGDRAVEDLLAQTGFRPVRSLVQMRARLDL